MKKIKPLAATLLGAAIFMLNGCGETEDKVEDVDKIQSENASTVRNDEKYEFELTGDKNVYRLEDKIETIKIDGDNNYITVVEDALIDSLIINGDGNVVDADDGLSLTIVDVELNGTSNVVNIYDAANITVDGTGNDVLESAPQ